MIEIKYELKSGAVEPYYFSQEAYDLMDEVKQDMEVIRWMIISDHIYIFVDNEQDVLLFRLKYE